MMELLLLALAVTLIIASLLFGKIAVLQDQIVNREVKPTSEFDYLFPTILLILGVVSALIYAFS